VEEIVVISPYFDAELSAPAQMQRLFQPHGWRIYTQDAVRAFPQAAAQKLFGPMGNAFHLAELDLEKGRRLHAKTLLLRTRQGAWLMTGSANATAPALLTPAHRGNTELVVVRYEPSPSYFDDWLQDLTQQAHPVSLADLLPPEIQEDEPAPSSPPTISIRASLEKDSLCVQVIDPPSEAPVPLIRLHQGDRIATTTPSLKPNTSDVWCAPVAAFPGVDVNAPVLVELTWGDEGPAGMAVLHNRQNLARFSRPLSRKDRPKLPPGLYPESDDHALQIMEMLQELLATNTEMLEKHRGPLAARSRRREETLALDEDDYDPEDYFVDEVVRTPIDAESGSSIYSNYHDRLSYEDILRALRSAFNPLTDATIIKTPEARADLKIQLAEMASSPQEQPTHKDDAAIQERSKTRLRSGLSRMIADFQRSKDDPAYHEAITSAYALELFVILMDFLTVVWREGMIDGVFFTFQTQLLLKTFWGDLNESGLWTTIQDCLPEEAKQSLYQRWQVVQRTWITMYVVANLLDSDKERYRLASWMRYFARIGASPDVLSELSDSEWASWWKKRVPEKWELKSSHQVIAFLRDQAQHYDEAALLDEIALWPNTQAFVTEETINYVEVPALRISTPMNAPGDFDRFLGAFLIFLLWPRPKNRAWAEFKNTNPPLTSDDTLSIRIFYYGDENQFWIARETSSGGFDFLIEMEDITPQQLVKMRNRGELKIKELPI
jgi:hypothetical protein